MSTPTPTPSKAERNGNSGSQKVKKPDLTMTVKEYLSQFGREGITADYLDKYDGKIIAITGRVKQFSFQVGGTAAPYVVLGVPGAERGVSCTLDTTNLDDHELIKQDQLVTLQGILDKPKVWEKPPPLFFCRVLRTVPRINTKQEDK